MDKITFVIIYAYFKRSLLSLKVVLTLAAFQQDPPRATAPWCQVNTFSPFAPVRIWGDKQPGMSKTHCSL